MLHCYIDADPVGSDCGLKQGRDARAFCSPQKGITGKSALRYSDVLQKKDLAFLTCWKEIKTLAPLPGRKTFYILGSGWVNSVTVAQGEVSRVDLLCNLASLMRY